MLSKMQRVGMTAAIGALWVLGCGGDDNGAMPSEGGTTEGGGTGGSTGNGDGATPITGLGATCAADTECTSGFMCIKPSDTLLGGGPSQGYCTMPCQGNSDCAAAGGACVGDGVTQPYCLISCTPGAVSADKCGGARSDLACERLVNNAGMVTGGACYPYCATDADCGTLKCNIGTGMCVASLPEGLPIGSNCTANVDPDPCLGQCYPLQDGTGPVPGFCSAPCAFGRLQGCGYHVGALDASASVAAACALPISSTGDIGDVGICLQMCDIDKDCLATDFGCDLGAVTTWKHGVCLPKDTSDAGPTGEGGVTPEVDGGSDAAPPEPDTGSPAPDASGGD
jgi:hypothetical protein